MTSLACSAAALAIALLAPTVLTHGDWSMRRPALAVGGWVAALLGGTTALVVAVAAWMLPVPMWQRAGCAGCGSTGAFAIGIGAAILLGAVAALIGGQAERIWVADRPVGSAVALLAGSSSRYEVTCNGITVSHVDGGLPALALSSRACGRQIVISHALERQLAPDELASVIEHERAHLDQRHDWIVRLARLNEACFPRLPGARVFAARVHLLVELLADDRAARVCGAETTASALLALADLTGDEGARLRACRLRSGTRTTPGSRVDAFAA